ncbi:MAG TPA: hypothetical protein VFN88_04360, partial [Caulobacteraceae bacterium]|nr:hypothetical protein [Caulobacteraceae bacterium]
PLGFSSDGKKVKLVLPLEAKDQVSVIAGALEDSPYFEEVRPTLDREKGRLLFDMNASGARKPMHARAAPAVNPVDALVR